MLDITGKLISKLLLTFKTIFPNYVAFERMEERLHLRIISAMTWTIHTWDDNKA